MADFNFHSTGFPYPNNVLRSCYLNPYFSGVMDEPRKEWYVRYFIKLCKPSHILNGTSENGGTDSTTVQITLVSFIDTDIGSFSNEKKYKALIS